MPWINHARIRRQAILLAVCLWLAYAAVLATPTLIDRAGHLKGADFLHAYILGSLANEHRPDALYDAKAQIDQGLKLVLASKDNWFVPIYPPQYSLFFAPLARIPYIWAFALWSLITAAIYGACCYFIWKLCPNLRGTPATVPHVRPNRATGRNNVGISRPSITIIILAIAFPGFITLIMFGQNSAVALGALTLVYFALRSRHFFLAGLALGLLAYKPTLALVAAAVFLFTLEWKVIAGAVASIAAQFAAVIAYYGPHVLRDYSHAITHLSQFAAILEPRPYLLHSLRAFWRMLLPWPAIATAFYVATSAAVILITVHLWRSGKSGLAPLPKGSSLSSRAQRGTPIPTTQHVSSEATFSADHLSLNFSILLVATALVSPHLTVYDLVIMAPALLFAADWLLANPDHKLAAPLRRLLYLSYWIPLLGPLSYFTHVQLSVPVFVTLLLCLAAIQRDARQPSPALSQAESALSNSR